MSGFSLVRGFSWTFAGNLAFAVSQWLFVVMIAKLGTPKDVGMFSLGLAIVAPIVLLSNLSLRAVQSTDAKGDFGFPVYFTVRLVTTLAALLTIAVIAVEGGFDGQASLIMVGFGLAKGVEAISDIFYGLMQKRDRMDLLGKSLMLRGSSSLIAGTAAFSLTRDLTFAVLASAASWLLVLAAHDLRESRKMLGGSSLFNPLHGRMLELARLAAPLGVAAALVSLSANIPRYFLEIYHGPKELGLFSATAYVTFVGLQVTNSLGQSASARLSILYANGDKAAFLKLLFRVAFISIVLGIFAVIVVAVAGKQILTALYTAEYAGQSAVFLWLMVASTMGLLTSVLGYAITAARYFRLQVAIFAFSAASTAAFCFVLIPRHGALGAAWAILAATLVTIPLMLGVVLHAVRSSILPACKAQGHTTREA